ncbi:hypothetical protein [Schlesneria paludicola]|uniref:hypothetical protein n=1 Tax=Schlesneria paludicola TaxID=360056 RepID=UPI00029AB6B8|nr:hypothetical protein [Schlesneria paludicola]
MTTDALQTMSLFKAASEIFREEITSKSITCEITFALSGDSGEDHNCLGCNFLSHTQLLGELLEIASEQSLIAYEQWISLACHPINAIWEQMSDVFEMISLPESYKCRNFQTFIRLRKWTNFFKHPKEFGWLVHHPNYCIESLNEANRYTGLEGYLIVDDTFVGEFYSANRAKGLANKFKQHQQTTVVIVPNIQMLMPNLCSEIRKFVDIVTKNPVYFEILRDAATLTDFFEHQWPHEASFRDTEVASEREPVVTCFFNAVEGSGEYSGKLVWSFDEEKSTIGKDTWKRTPYASYERFCADHGHPLTIAEILQVYLYPKDLRAIERASRK